MKYIFSLLVFALCAVTLSGQKISSVSGVLSDKGTGEPVELANVTLLNAKDSSFLVGEFSNNKGVFTFKNITKGEYILKVTYLGFQDFFKTISLSGENPNENIGKIELASGDIMLQEAVVTGKAAEVVVKNDTIEYNADSYKTLPNSAVEDLLKKLPGVEVDKDGKIMVNGKEVKKFLVDGKEFFSDDPKVASKNLPAEMVEKLQVMDRKSDLSRMTGFDDGEEETVINLTVKPGMKKGTLGNAMAGLGKDLGKEDETRYEAGVILNHLKNNDRYTLMLSSNNTNNMGASDLSGQRFGGMRGMRRGSGGILESQNFAVGMNREFSTKLSMNGDVSYNEQDRNSTSNVKKATFAKAKSQSQLDSTSSINNDASKNFNASFRIEWKPDTSNTFIFRPNFGYNSSLSDQSQFFGRYKLASQDTVLFEGNSKSHNRGNGYLMGLSTEYSHRFSKPGRVLSISFRGSINDSYSQENFNDLRHNYNEGIFVKDSTRNKRYENDNNSNNYRVYTSYVEPIGRNNFIQVAYSFRNYTTESVNSTYGISEREIYGTPLVDTATIIGDESRSTSRYSTEQRFSFNFKSVREKYNYTIGLNLDPTKSNNETFQPYNNVIEPIYLPLVFDGRLPNVMGDSLISSIDQKVINFSPVLNFNYLFGKRTNLRIDYEGETVQPTANQLLDKTDQSDPTNLVRGNPGLKPGYNNSFSARFNKFVPESQLFYNVDLRGNMSFNDIASVTEILGSGRLTTYENINGNWDMMLRAGFNTPLKNKKFTIGNFGMSSLRNTNSYSNREKTVSKDLSFMDRVMANYRSGLFDFGISGMFRYRKMKYDIDPANNQETYDWEFGASTTWYLPQFFTLETDFSATTRSGYAKGFNIPEAIWNAAITKQLFNKKYGTGSLKLKIYDILQDRSNVSGSSSTNGYQYSQSNTIPSFFMCSFIYKFSVFPGGSSATENDVRGEDRRWDGRRGGGSRNF